MGDHDAEHSDPSATFGTMHEAHRVLNEDTDQQYHERYPEAPAVLDPHNHEHEFYIKEWLKMRDDNVDIMATTELQQRDFEADGHIEKDLWLQRGNPADTKPIDHFLDIRAQIAHETPASTHWDPDAPPDKDEWSIPDGHVTSYRGPDDDDLGPFPAMEGPHPWQDR
jgi:hypothetical protein